MMSVSILMNGEPIYTRTVVNVGRRGKAKQHTYRLDTGEKIMHNPADGAIPLAIKMLETIHEVRKTTL